MTKELTKELEFIRKAVIMACHSECESFEDALEKELGFGCIFTHSLRLSTFKKYWQIVNITNSDVLQAKLLNDDGLRLGTFYYQEDLWKEHTKIIGKPITLARVLIAFEKGGACTSTMIYRTGEWKLSVTAFTDKLVRTIVTKWDLTKDLDQQSTELILSISKLLGL